MKLYVSLPGVFKFQPLFDDSEYLQSCLTQDPRTMSVWYINEGVDIGRLKEVLNEYKINYRLKE